MPGQVRRNVPISQRGWLIPSKARRMLGRSGVENPFFAYRSGLTWTGRSTVTTRVRKPAALMRSSSSTIRFSSPGM